MSMFSLGRHSHASVATPDARPWWDWNPYRAKSVVTPAEVAQPQSWWNWNPYRRDVRHAEAAGRREGYRKGVHDEQRVVARRRRRSHPIIGLVVFLAAVAGFGIVGLAVESGSFTGAGAQVDQKIAEWRGDVLGAAGSTGETTSSQSQQVVRSGQ